MNAFFIADVTILAFVVVEVLVYMMLRPSMSFSLNLIVGVGVVVYGTLVSYIYDLFLARCFVFMD